MLKSKEKILATLKNNLTVTQEIIKYQVDKGHTKREFATGDWVYLRFLPYI